MKTEQPSAQPRQRAGTLSGAVGIVLNLLLFALKLTAGLLSGSIAILADAFNNLSDAGSSLVTLAAFRMAGRKPDADHPFGHGRLEYIAGLVVSLLILLVGVELLRTSVGRILHAEAVTWSRALLFVLLVSIVVKLGMFLFNRGLARRTGSAALRAVARDSLCDAAATAVVLLGTLAAHLRGWQIDGWLGLAVSAFILYTGICSLRETLQPLLGAPPDPALIRAVEERVRQFDGVRGIHDLVVHDYGPGRLMLSLHAEVPRTLDLTTAHDIADQLEKSLRDDFLCEAVVHIDPVATDDPRVTALRSRIAARMIGQDSRLTIHDFRLVPGTDHETLVFDVVAPFDCPAERVRAMAEAAARAEDPSLRVSIQVDHPYA